MPKQIKVGLVTDAGGPHLGAYFSALAAIDEVESVALVDPSGDSVEAARKTLGGRLSGVYQSLPKMLKAVKPAMALVSMEAAQAPAAIDVALHQGCHVFAEKPACVRSEDFGQLSRLADSKHLSLMLAFANRLNPEVVAARNLIQSGEIGKIYGVELRLIEDQTRLTRPGYHQSWFAKKSRAGGGHLSWLGIHWLDLAVFLTGARIEQVAGFTTNVGGQPIDIEDSAVVSMRYDNGALGTLTSGYYLDRGFESHIRIWGAEGWLQIQSPPGKPLQWYTTSGGVQEYKGASTPRGYTPFVRAAVRACAGLEDPPISNADSLHAIESVFGVYEAAAEGKSKTI